MRPSTGSSRQSHAARILARVRACAAVAVVAGGLVTTPAPAQTVFSDRAAFLAALVSTPETYAAPETLSCSLPPTCVQLGQVFDIGPLQVTSGAVWIRTSLDFGPPNAYGWLPDAPSGPPTLPGPSNATWVTLESARPLYAFGVDYGAPLAGPPPVSVYVPLTFSFAFDNGLSFTRTTPVSLVPGNPEVGKLSYQFFGVISPTPFTQFTIEVHPNPLSPPAILDARYDDVTIAAVPEPGTLGLTIAGVVMVGAAIRRRRGARA